MIDAKSSTILQLSELVGLFPQIQERLLSMNQEIVKGQQFHRDENLQQMLDTILEVTKMAIEKNQFIDQSRHISIGGDLNAEDSEVTFGDIHNSEFKTLINQLPDSVEEGQKGLKELLTELDQVIEEETKLSTEEKEKLREGAKALIEAPQTTEPEKKSQLVQRTKEIFSIILRGLPPTAAIVKACSELLPQILRILGLPA